MANGCRGGRRACEQESSEEELHGKAVAAAPLLRKPLHSCRASRKILRTKTRRKELRHEGVAAFSSRLSFLLHTFV
jgi:hypothetical protein